MTICRSEIVICNLYCSFIKAIAQRKPTALETGEMNLVCHGPGSLKRMNPYATLENARDNKESLEVKTKNNKVVVSEVEVTVKDNLEVFEETRKRKT